ncbi:fluoride efflux transporter CrcB [Neomegalonema perideroedes]|uniref:fluoride efflux transporter CrcB n=1 Tax=Neomegalonema perideroedes TaxID=217219 RepID=UPI000381C4A8|nr:fluoride efflux transporter CrcB [Neomegalonema perideroedes]
MTNGLTASLLVGLGGGLGAMLRHWTILAVGRIWPSFPMGVLLANIAGSFAMGLVAGWLARRGGPSAEGWRLFLATGVLGGFTTFSAFSLDFQRLLAQERWLGATLYAGLSVALALAALVLGLWLMKRFG